MNYQLQKLLFTAFLPTMLNSQAERAANESERSRAERLCLEEQSVSHQAERAANESERSRARRSVFALLDRVPLDSVVIQVDSVSVSETELYDIAWVVWATSGHRGSDARGADEEQALPQSFVASIVDAAINQQLVLSEMERLEVNTLDVNRLEAEFRSLKARFSNETRFHRFLNKLRFIPEPDSEIESRIRNVLSKRQRVDTFLLMRARGQDFSDGDIERCADFLAQWHREAIGQPKNKLRSLAERELKMAAAFVDSEQWTKDLRRRARVWIRPDFRFERSDKTQTGDSENADMVHRACVRSART